MSTPLDTATVPLGGLALVEASAGTGKTHAITELFLRLVLDGGLGVEQILVVTFTNAATAELRARIRGALRAVAARLGGGPPGAHATLADALADPEAARQRAGLAMRSLDLAAVHTIHGFCQRVLAEWAFESGAPFRGEILTDPGPDLERVIADFHRRELAGASALYARALQAAAVTPRTLLTWVRSHLGRAYAGIVQPAGGDDGAAAESAYRDGYRHAREAWLGDAGGIAALLATHPDLNRSRYRRDRVETWVAQTGAALRSPDARADLPECVARLTREAVCRGTRKGGTPPEHPFFDACEVLVAAQAALAAAHRDRSARMRVRLLEHCRRELPARLRPRRQRTYDDLLREVHDALRGPAAAGLAAALRARYPAVLVDEFQDTDPLQLEVLSALFAPNGSAFLVGDPKQAIYSFRGADVFAYLRARRLARRRYTLLANWRARAPLVAAVNALFARPARAFVLEGIDFEPAVAAPGERGALEIEGKSGPALRLWLPRWGGAEGITRTLARDEAAATTAADVARLLDLAAHDRARLDGRPIIGSDVAVLVRTHAQARAVRGALRAVGVGSVQYSDENVFDAPEAGELEWLLAAVAEPARESAVRAALATPLLGRDGAALWSLAHDAATWDACLERFRRWHELWRDHGFARMFRRLLADEEVAPRLLGQPDGARRLTNVRHLADLLAGRQDQSPGMLGLVRWLAERRRAGAPADEVSQLRLESDRDLVRVVTVHRSKGLEFPVVYVPFAWDASAPAEPREGFVFHDAADGERLKLVVGEAPSPQALERSRAEDLAEEVRLLYVALTRASHRCTVLWGAARGFEHGALAWLLHAPRCEPGDGDRVAVARAVAAMDDEALETALIEALQDAGGAAAVGPPPAAGGAAHPARAETPAPGPARRFAARVPPAARATSFTALSTGRAPARRDREGDAPPPPVASGTPPAGLHGLPRGARTGTCLHEVLERMDGSVRGEALARLAAERVTANGLEARWAPVLAAALPRVLATVIDEDTGLRLDALAPGRRVAEMAFHYPVCGIEARGLGEVIAAHAPEAAAGLPPIAPVHGWMKGFVDLVFEHDGRFGVLDYKSNWLGPDADAYRPEALAAAMTREGYHLQYLLYVVAVHRWLRLRRSGYDYERDFGHVYYLFLRGIEPERGAAAGVYRTRPPLALVEALDRYLAVGGRGA